MLTTLTEVTLRGGAIMSIRMFEPPQEDYARRLMYFLRHKDDDSARGIRQRVLGQYVEHCLDRYFVGEVDGQIVGQAWYGLPRQGTGVGNFGHVYTDPAWRGQGVAGEITRVLVEHFNAEPTGVCLLCTASEQSGRIYRRFGFEFIPPTNNSGSMGLIKPEVAGSFAELDERYFAPGQEVSVREGHIGHRHDIDRLLDFSAPWIEARQRWHFVMLASRVPTFISALHYVEDNRGLITVLQTASGNVVGYAFALNLGSRYEKTLKTFDFVLHPHYLHEAPRLIEETAQRVAGPVHAAVAVCDEKKLAALLQAGFVEVQRLEAAFHRGEGRHDVLLLKRDVRTAWSRPRH